MMSRRAAKLLQSIVFVVVMVLAPAGAHACTPGAGPARCPGTISVWDNRTQPLTREDINARIGTPGAPIGGAVTADTSRTWNAVRRQPRRPVIAYPADPPHMERKGEMP
jgi:hypothetical protein